VSFPDAWCCCHLFRNLAKMETSNLVGRLTVTAVELDAVRCNIDGWSCGVFFHVITELKESMPLLLQTVKVFHCCKVLSHTISVLHTFVAGCCLSCCNADLLISLVIAIAILCWRYF